MAPKPGPICPPHHFVAQSPDDDSRSTTPQTEPLELSGPDNRPFVAAYRFASLDTTGTERSGTVFSSDSSGTVVSAASSRTVVSDGESFERESTDASIQAVTPSIIIAPSTPSLRTSASVTPRSTPRAKVREHHAAASGVKPVVEIPFSNTLATAPKHQIMGSDDDDDDNSPPVSPSAAAGPSRYRLALPRDTNVPRGVVRRQRIKGEGRPTSLRVEELAAGQREPSGPSGPDVKINKRYRWRIEIVNLWKELRWCCNECSSASMCVPPDPASSHRRCQPCSDPARNKKCSIGKRYLAAANLKRYIDAREVNTPPIEALEQAYGYRAVVKERQATPAGAIVLYSPTPSPRLAPRAAAPIGAPSTSTSLAHSTHAVRAAIAHRSETAHDGSRTAASTLAALSSRSVDMLSSDAETSSESESEADELAGNHNDDDEEMRSVAASVASIEFIGSSQPMDPATATTNTPPTTNTPTTTNTPSDAIAPASGTPTASGAAAAAAVPAATGEVDLLEAADRIITLARRGFEVGGDMARFHRWRLLIAEYDRVRPFANLPPEWLEFDDLLAFGWPDIDRPLTGPEDMAKKLMWLETIGSEYCVRRNIPFPNRRG